MIFNKDMLQVYAVTDRSWNKDKSLYVQVEEALKGKVTIVQLREKELSEEEFLEEAINIRELCDRYNVPLIINDNVDIAIKSKAAGVHVGQSDCPVSQIRKRVDKNFIIGTTAKTIEQAIKAQKEGADYLGVGAVFASPTKKDAIRITNEQLKNIRAAVTIPVVAIGGINIDNMFELKGSNVDGMAFVSAIFAAEDIEKRVKLLKKNVEDILKK